ncbi:MAG TPA: RNA-binding protein [Candidatus Thermoplasmatota archaeon]|nr:RNA-binding protein [Candidatus Thermoplasmatota archaeon]
MMADEVEDDNIIFVGNKAPMNYVIAVLTEFKKNNEVIIKARGRSISKAVEAGLLVKKKFMKEAEIIEIKVDLENIIDDKTQKPMDIPAIEIYLATPEK